MTRALLDKLVYHSFQNYQIVYNERRFHNHNIHHLSSLYFLGVNDDKLEKAYEEMCKKLDRYEISPDEINLSNWRNYLGNRHFSKSYRDFFHKQLTISEDKWHEKFLEFLLENPEHPMINGIVGGLAHPLIHIGYAFELDSRIAAVEALAMTAVCYNYLHETIDQLKLPIHPSKSPMEIFNAIHADIYLPIYNVIDTTNLELIVQDYNSRILTYYNEWNIHVENIEKTIEELFDLTVYIYGATHKSNDIGFSFVLVHLLTAMNAIRIIYSNIDNQTLFQHLLCQFFYFAMIIYVCESRPAINPHLIDDYQINEKTDNWNYVLDRTLNTEFINDAHLVKVIRALHDAEKLYGHKNGFYLKTAIKTVDNMNVESMWIRGSSQQRQLNILKH